MLDSGKNPMKYYNAMSVYISIECLTMIYVHNDIYITGWSCQSDNYRLSRAGFITFPVKED